MQTPIELTAAFFITQLWETEGLGGSRWPGSLDGFTPVLALFGSLRILPAAFSCCPEVLYATMAILLRIIVLLLTCGFSMEHRRQRAHADVHDVLYGDDNSSNGTLQPVTQWDLHQQEAVSLPASSQDARCSGNLICMPPVHNTGPTDPWPLPTGGNTEAQAAALDSSGDAASSARAGPSGSHTSSSQPDVTFSWPTCVNCVVALAMRQHPSPTPTETWTWPALQNQVLRALLHCAVEATSLDATLGEVNVGFLSEGLSEEYAAALTDTLHRRYAADALPVDSGESSATAQQ